MSGRAPLKANLTLLKHSGPGPLRSRRTWRGLQSRRPRGRVVKATTTPSNHKRSPQPVTEAPSQLKVTATRKKKGPKMPKPMSAAATKPAAGKTKKKAAASVKTPVAKPTNPELVDPIKSSTFPVEDISDLLDHLAIQTFVELPRRLLTSIASLPKRASRPRAVLKTVILFVAEYGSTP